MEKILLHCCCAPCSAPILEWMQNNHIFPTLFFYNPNIFPAEEYIKRKKELIRYAESLGLDFIDGDYEHDIWLKKVEGFEEDPERGQRCAQCFKMRMEATALLASQKGFPIFTTTLTGSRWKSFEQIVNAGNYAASLTGNVRFWDKDWKKGGLTERRKILLEQNNFYNQQYCGCEFSLTK